MKKISFLIAMAAMIFCLANPTQASYNRNAKFQLHFAGTHDAKTHTCTFQVTDCRTSPLGQMVVDAPGGAGRYDVYVLAIDTSGIAGVRYGLWCTGDFFFYGWTKCSLLEIPTSGWPGSGEGDAQTFGSQLPAGHITLGILDVYAYPGAVKMCTGNDPSSTPIANEWAQFCDASVPDPKCNKTNEVAPELEELYFGCVGFNGNPGVNRCGIIATEKQSWGLIKSLYR
jgi:hypothetical protein